MTLIFNQEKRALFVTSVEDPGYKMYLSPPPPFSESEKLFLNDLVRRNREYVAGANFGKEEKKDFRHRAQILFDMVLFLSCLSEEDGDDAWDQELADAVAKTMGPDWDIEKMRKEWSTFGRQGFLEPHESSRLTKITGKEHVVMYDVVSWD